MKRIPVVLLLGAVVLVTPSFAGGADAPDAAAIYKAKCAMCHGPDGKGLTTMGKNLHLKDLGSADVQKLKDEELEKIITDGKTKMPAYKAKLSEAEINALVPFLRALAPKQK